MPVTSEAHTEMADYYVTVVDKTWVQFPAQPLSEQDTRVCELLLHAADTHLKLAEAKRKTYPHQDGEHTILGPETFTDKDASVVAYRGDNYYRRATGPLPGTRYVSQMEALGG